VKKNPELLDTIYFFNTFLSGGIYYVRHNQKCSICISKFSCFFHSNVRLVFEYYPFRIVFYFLYSMPIKILIGMEYNFFYFLLSYIVNIRY